MAIYSCKHGSVGRTSHAAGTAGAHARYVTRPGAAREIVGEHMPLGRETSKAWLDDQEQADRKNARVIDKVMVALPVELDADQRVQLVRDFAAEIGRGRIAWVAGVHDQGEDGHNPHAHLVFRDRDFETGKRVAELSAKGSTERVREVWERVANEALERAGTDARIDRRTLEAQGIAREPGIHVGPNVVAMEEKGIRPESLPQELENGRVVNWPEIDQGRTRADRLREIAAENAQVKKDADGKTVAGAPPASAAPAPSSEITDARERWAQRLRELAAADEAARARETPQPAPPPPEPAEPSPTPAEGTEGRTEQRQRIVAVEKGRLIAAIERGWEKLAGLAHRLEAAWQGIVRRQEPPSPKAEQLRLEPAPPSRETQPPEVRLAPASPKPGPDESAEERRKRRYAELLAEQIAKRPPPPPNSGPTFGR